MDLNNWLVHLSICIFSFPSQMTDAAFVKFPHFATWCGLIEGWAKEKNKRIHVMQTGNCLGFILVVGS